MGVYSFESKHGPFVKIGHFIGENAWRRIAPIRGFYSTSHPQELRLKLGPSDFELRHWFPTLGPQDEKCIHSKLRDFRIIGEWYSLEVLLMLDRLSECENTRHLCNFAEAMNYKSEISIRDRIILRKGKNP